MKEEDTLLVVLGSLDKMAAPSKENYELLCAAVEIGIKALYRAGLEAREKDGSK